MAEKNNDDQTAQTRRRGRSPKEFRRDAAALVIEQRRSIAEVPHASSVSSRALGNWVRQEPRRPC